VVALDSFNEADLIYKSNDVGNFTVISSNMQYLFRKPGFRLTGAGKNGFFLPSFFFAMHVQRKSVL
jgi:hypothetical protein